MLDRTHPPAANASFDFTIPQAETTVVNNTRFHVIHAGNLPVVKIEILFRQGGSIVDSIPGQSFMTNKMLLHGTSQLDTAQIAETLDSLGAFARFSPSFDDPSLEVYCLTKHLPRVLPVIRDILSDSVFPEEEFTLVRDITLQQLEIQNSRNNVVASKVFRSRLFGEDHPYGKILSAKDIQQLDADALRGFYSSRLPEFEVIVTGALSSEDNQLIFGHLAFSKEVETIDFNAQTAQNFSPYYEEKNESLQTSLRIGRQIPHKSADDYISLRICIHALGGYFGSRLMKNIREDKGYTYGIHASVVPLIHGSYLTIGTDVQKEFREPAIAEIYKEMERLQQTSIPENELMMVKNHLLGSFQSELDSPLSLSSKFLGVYLYGLSYGYYDELIARIRDISPAEIQDIAVTYLQTDQFTEVSVG